MTDRNDTMGRTGFVDEHGLWTDNDRTEAERIVRLIEENRLEVIRLSYPDQHGILRGKTIMAGEAEQAMRNGCAITTTLLAKDTSHTTVFPVFSPGGGFGIPEMENAGDFIAVPVPPTFRVCPGLQAPAGYCATAISPTAIPSRSRLVKSWKRRWRHWKNGGSTTSPGLRLSATFTGSKTRCSGRKTPDSRRSLQR